MPKPTDIRIEDIRHSYEDFQYRTPIKGFFLTGASTHPGGGVFGASGRNAARVVAKHFGFRQLR